MEIFKRILVILGIIVLFFLSFLILSVGSQYGADSIGDVGILQYLGLKKASPAPVVGRNVNYLEAPETEIERIAKDSTPVSSSSPSVNNQADVNTFPVTDGVPYNPNPTSYSIQAPEDAF